MPPWQSEERWQSDETASVATSKGVSDVTGVELGSVMSGDAHQDNRETLQDSVCTDLLHAVVCGLVIVGAIFTVHWIIVLSFHHHKPKSHHRWDGTDSVSNDVRLEVEKKWLGGQKSLPTGVIFHEGRHSHHIDSISAQEFHDAIRRLQRKAAVEGTSSSPLLHPPPPPSSLLVPIDRIAGSRGGNLGLNHIAQLSSGAKRLGGGEVTQDDDGVWVPRRDGSDRRARPPGRARLPAPR